MKKQNQSSISKAAGKTILFLSLATLLLMGTVPAGAQENKAVNPVEIKYLGLLDNQPVFQIEFSNQDSELYQISIKDEEGNLLYSEKTREKKFIRKFKWEKADTGSGKLTFTLAGRKEKQSQVFEVNTNIRVVEDVVVTRL